MVHNIDAHAVLKHKGLDAGGKVQQFFVQECDRYMSAYLPARSGLQMKNRFLVPDGIVYGGPYAKFLYYGKVMVGIESGSPWAKKDEPKRVTNQDLLYDKTKNPQAGAFWDKRMWVEHRDDILQSMAKVIGGAG